MISNDYNLSVKMLNGSTKTIKMRRNAKYEDIVSYIKSALKKYAGKVENIFLQIESGWEIIVCYAEKIVSTNIRLVLSLW